MGYLTHKQLDSLTIEITHLPSEPKLDLQTDFKNLIAKLHFQRQFLVNGVLKEKNDLPTEVNNAAVVYYQIGVRDLRKSAIMDIIEIAWGDTFFDVLRRNKQLGYIVGARKVLVDTTMVY